MKLDFKKLTQTLLALDKRMQEIDEIVKNVRVEINNLLWDLIELKKNGK